MDIYQIQEKYSNEADWYTYASTCSNLEFCLKCLELFKEDDAKDGELFVKYRILLNGEVIHNG